MANRVLLTGGAGFIGSHLSERFLSNGWSVEILDNFSSGKRENIPSHATLHELDVRSEDANRLVRGGGFDVLVHLAGQMDVRRSVADPIFDANVNIVGTLNMLEAIRVGARKDTRFLFSSTGGVLYGDFVTPPNIETVSKDPESPYAISKLSAEFYLAYYLRVHGLDTVSLRFGNVYGPRQDPHGEAGVVAIFCGRILEGRTLTVFGDGKQTRDYVFVDDVTAATLMAATQRLPNAGKMDARAFNIGTGIGTPVLDIANGIMAAAGTTAKLEFAAARAGEQRHSYLTVDKVREWLGWTAETPLANGLRQTYEWFAERHKKRGPSTG